MTLYTERIIDPTSVKGPQSSVKMAVPMSVDSKSIQDQKNIVWSEAIKECQSTMVELLKATTQTFDEIALQSLGSVNMILSMSKDLLGKDTTAFKYYEQTVVRAFCDNTQIFSGKSFIGRKKLPTSSSMR